jgi:periplasmic divalent cation tolerance protein
MYGIVGNLKITYCVSGRSFEDFVDIHETLEFSLKHCEQAKFRIEEVTYIEDTVYGVVLSLLEPEYIEDEYLIGSGNTHFSIERLDVSGDIALNFLKTQHKREYCIVLTTVGNNEDATRIIDSVLKYRLAACVQTTSIGSHYFWEGEICHDQEVLIAFKTSKALYSELEFKLKELHPYTTPEIIAVDISNGFKGYFDWIDEVTLHK